MQDLATLRPDIAFPIDRELISRILAPHRFLPGIDTGYLTFVWANQLMDQIACINTRQEEVLFRVAECLGDSGRLLLRVADTRAGARSVFTYLGDRVGTLLRGELWPRHIHRPISEWSKLLEQLGFRVSTRPMSQGTPFSNILLIADRS